MSFLIQMGSDALTRKGEKLERYRRLLKAATAHHETELAAKRSVAATASKLREARKSLA